MFVRHCRRGLLLVGYTQTIRARCTLGWKIGEGEFLHALSSFRYGELLAALARECKRKNARRVQALCIYSRCALHSLSLCFLLISLSPSLSHARLAREFRQCAAQCAVCVLYIFVYARTRTLFNSLFLRRRVRAR